MSVLGPRPKTIKTARSHELCTFDCVVRKAWKVNAHGQRMVRMPSKTL